MSGTRVTAEDIETGDDGVTEIRDNYVLITDGRCHRARVQVNTNADGTQTHVITVKGVRQPRPPAIVPLNVEEADTNG